MFLCNNITSIQYKVHVIKSSEIGIYQLKTSSESCPSWRGTRDFSQENLGGSSNTRQQQIFARIELLRLQSKLWIHLLFKRRSFCNQLKTSSESCPSWRGTRDFSQENLGGSSNTRQTANIRENRTPPSSEQALNPPPLQEEELL